MACGTEPFKWTGKNPSLEVQCGRVRPVLMRHHPIPPKELLDLTTYIKSLPPHRVVRERGRHADAVAGARQGDFLRHHDPGGQEIPHERPVLDVSSPAAVLGAAVIRRGHRRHVRHAAFAGHRASAPYLHDGRHSRWRNSGPFTNPNACIGVSSYMNKISSTID